MYFLLWKTPECLHPAIHRIMIKRVVLGRAAPRTLMIDQDGTVAAAVVTPGGYMPRDADGAFKMCGKRVSHGSFSISPLQFKNARTMNTAILLSGDGLVRAVCCRRTGGCSQLAQFVHKRKQGWADRTRLKMCSCTARVPILRSF